MPRRILVGTLCRQNKEAIAERFQALGQEGVAVSRGVQAMASRATLGYHQGYAILTA